MLTAISGGRDSNMEKVSEELRQKRGKDSLLDIHGKKLKKKKNNEEEGQPKVLWDPI